MNNINKIVYFLDSILGDHKEFGKDEYYYQCPFCSKKDGKKKLAIKLNPDAVGKNGESIFTSYHCWRDVSHAGHNLYSLLRKMNLNNLFPELTSILKESNINMDLTTLNDKFNPFVQNERPLIELPKEFKSILKYSNTTEYKNAIKYLKYRGITKGDIVKNNIGYAESGEFSGYIIIPSYDINGNINFFAGRSYQKNAFKKHKIPSIDKNIIFNELHIDWNEPIILCEGLFDYLAIKRNAIPILGKYISKNLMHSILKNKVKQLYLSLDNDAIKDSIKHIEIFLKNDIGVHLINLDTYKDPSSAGFDIFWNYFNQARKINFSELIKLKMKYN